MEKLIHVLEKTVDDFNNINQIKGFKAEYSLWNRTSNNCFVPNDCYTDFRQSDQRQIYFA